MKFRSRLILFLALICLFAVIAPGLTIALVTKESLKQSFGAQALQITSLALRQLKTDDVKHLVTIANEARELERSTAQVNQDSFFLHTSKQLNQIRTQSGARDVYLMSRLPDGTLFYVVDAAGDESFGANQSFPGKVVDTPDPLAKKAFLTSQPQTGEWSVDAQWGAYITSYVPVTAMNSAYPVVLGVDFHAEAIASIFQFQNQLIISIAGSTVLLVMVISWFFAKSVTKPLHQLVQACRQIASGDWRLIELESNQRSDEFGELQESFRTMVSEVRYKQIESRNQQLESQQMYLERVMSDLQEVKDGVQRGSRFLKHALLHDLGLMGIFAEKASSALSYDVQSSVIEDLNVIQQKQVRLAELIEKIDLMTSEISLRPEPFPLSDWIDRLLAGKQPLFLENDITVVTCGSKAASLHADRAHMSEVIYNLIQNAADAMKKVPHRTLTIDWNGNEKGVLWIKVTDTGEGIAPEHIGQLKELFFTTKQGGHHFGMGLYYCEQVMRQHQGILVIDSERGQGTNVTLYFPSLEMGGQEDDQGSTR